VADQMMITDRDLLNMKLGGGVSRVLLAGRVAGMVEKKHLVLRRLFSARAQQAGVDFIDLGTDAFYPFYANYSPTTAAIESIRHHAETARSYPSSFGLIELRRACAAFMKSRFNVEIDPLTEVMLTTGASQSFDALSRSFSGTYFLIPELTLSTVRSIAIANGAIPLVIPTEPDTGLPSVSGIAQQLQRLPCPTVRFIYLNYPNNPTGRTASRQFFTDIVQLARQMNLLIVHDMDTWHLNYEGGPLTNILEIEGARDVAISILSLSKEFGLPGIRIGFVVGNAEIINVLRIHNSEFCVMLPEMCQRAAIAALESFADDDERKAVGKRIELAMRTSVDMWKTLGWPEEAISPPSAGFKYLVLVPPKFRSENGVSRVELFDFFVASHAFVKLSTSRSFNDNNENYIRTIVMQDAPMMEVAFRRIQESGVHYDMSMPDGLAEEYLSTLEGINLASL